MKLTFSDYLKAVVFWVVMFFLFTSFGFKSSEFKKRNRQCRRIQKEIQHEHRIPAGQDPMRKFRNQDDYRNTPTFYLTNKTIKHLIR